MSSNNSLTGWQIGVRLVCAIAISVLVVLFWRPGIGGNDGFLYSDSNHLILSYQTDLQIHPLNYLPFVNAHRPLGNDAFTLLVRLWGEHYPSIALSELFVHACTTIVLFFLLIRLGGSIIPAAIGAVFMGLHPAGYWAIYWPAAIYDLLSTFFSVCAVYVFLRALELSGRSRGWLLLLNIVLFDLAVKSKETAFVLVGPMIVLYGWKLLTDTRNSEGPTDPFALLKLSLKRIPAIDKIYFGALTAVVVTLYLFVASDFRPEVVTPDMPYAKEYSLPTVLTAFGYYMYFTAYFIGERAPMSIEMAGILLLVIAGIVALNRRLLTLLGLAWWFSFLIFLSVLRNMYASPNYPYPSIVGVSMVLCGLTTWLQSKLSGGMAKRIFGWAISVCVLGLVIWQSWVWLYTDGIPRWYRMVNLEGIRMRRSLVRVVPAPADGTEFLVVVPHYSLFDQGDIFVEALYRNWTLKAHVFPTVEKLKNYVDEKKPERSVLLQWEDNKKFVPIK